MIADRERRRDSEAVVDVLVVDDEPAARRGVRRMLQDHDGFRVAAECEDAAGFLDALRRHDPDLVFLDIQMPGMDAFEALRRVPAGDVPLVVFISAYDRYAVRAFETHAVDYLLKPVDPERFGRACDRARRRLQAREAEDYATRLLHVVEALERRLGENGQPTPSAAGPTGGTAEPFVARLNQRMSLIDPADILWVTSARDYVRLHTADGTHLVRDTMTSVAERLEGAGFVRIHRSTLVRLDAVREFHFRPNGGLDVGLPDNETRSVSQSGRERLSEALGFDL